MSEYVKTKLFLLVLEESSVSLKLVRAIRLRDNEAVPELSKLRDSLIETIEIYQTRLDRSLRSGL